MNTWDIGRVSWGFTQWTLGRNGNGTLAEFMRDLKKADPAMQQAQIKFANDGKISGTRDRSVSVTGRDAEGHPKAAKRKLKDVATSEYGNAIMTDLAVNAGSGGKVAASALEKYVKDKGVDPARVKDWGPDAEKAIIAALEHASRSERLAHHAKAGFSKDPGSFAD